MDRGNGIGRDGPAGSEVSAGSCDRQVFAVGTPSAGDQPFAAAAADDAWLCVVRPGNIGRHGDNKGFGKHIFLRGKTADALVRRIVRTRRETTVNRTVIRCQTRSRALLQCCSAMTRKIPATPKP